EYIARVLGASEKAQDGELPGPVARLARSLETAHHREQFFPTRQPSGETTWRRISLAPGVELHLREPVEPQDAKRLRELLNTAYQIFGAKPQGGPDEPSKNEF
ncbi:MAG: hypothetical protein M1281_19040, partial [Chloroflexi bacterium]|nr:hypothetical protein [Chloroflexota bacterium]